MSDVSPATATKLVIAMPGLNSPRGHGINFAVTLADEVQRRRMKCAIFARKDARLVVLRRPRALAAPEFRPIDSVLLAQHNVPPHARAGRLDRNLCARGRAAV